MKRKWQNAAAFVVMLAFLCLNLPHFWVYGLEFGTLNAVTEEELASFSTFTAGNIFRKDLGRLRDAVLDHPWINAAQVYWQWPNRILVEVQEHRPIAKVPVGHVWVFLSDSGQMLPRPIHGLAWDLPVVYLSDLASVEERMGAARIINGLPDSLNERIAQWNHDSNYFLTREGIRIHIGETTDMLRKYQVLEALLTELDQKRETPRLIDIQAPTTPVVYFRE